MVLKIYQVIVPYIFLINLADGKCNNKNYINCDKKLLSTTKELSTPVRDLQFNF
jgi:hypothetical protein